MIFPRAALRTSARLAAAALLAGVFVMGGGAAPIPASAQGYGLGYFDGPGGGKKAYRKKRSRTQAARRNREAPIEETAAAPATHSSPSAPVAGAASSKPGAAPAAATAEGPLFAVVTLAGQHITIYNHEGVVARSRVSTGKAGHPTPKGLFTIIQRNRHHRSNIYAGAPMPFMQRVTWSGVALHQGVVPGYPASHGCIRLPSGFASHLWGLTKIGERIVIAGPEVKPQAFDHASLPKPKLQAAVAVTGSAGASAAPVQVATADGSGATPAPSPAQLNPLEFAEQLRAQAKSNAAAAEKRVKEAADAAAAKKAEGAKSAADLKAAANAHAAAERAVAASERAAGKATASTQAAADAAKAAAGAALAAATERLDAARMAHDEHEAALTEAQRVWREAKEAVEAARQAEIDARRRTAPVSVLFSKKDQKVYVRQGLAPVFEAPASVRDPEKPLGTHLYIATRLKESKDALAWTSLTMPPQSAESERAKRKKKGAREDAIAAVAPPATASSAAEALERIDVAADVWERISERLWAGGSFIISDNPLSGETSDIGTDLVVKVR